MNVNLAFAAGPYQSGHGTHLVNYPNLFHHSFYTLWSILYKYIIVHAAWSTWIVGSLVYIRPMDGLWRRETIFIFVRNETRFLRIEMDVPNC